MEICRLIVPVDVNDANPNRVKKRPWTDEEIAILREAYSKEVVNLIWLSEKLGRTKAKICTKAKKLGLTRRKRRKVEVRKHDQRRKYESDHERRGAQSAYMVKRLREQGHPRGMLGRRHSKKVKEEQSARATAMNQARTQEDKRRMADQQLATKLERYGTAGPGFRSANAFSRCKGGRRADLGDRYFRSAWEANYARYLNWLQRRGQIKDWQYEPQTFVFHGVIRGALTYTPDFLIIENNESESFHEVKGWMTSKSKTKLNRMAKYYPSVRIVLIGEKEYREIENKVGRLIEGWEYKSRRR